MLVMKGVYLVFCLLLYTNAEQEVNVIQAMSTNIGDIVLECQEEMSFPNEVIKDFLSFWNEHNQLRSGDLGCVLVCVFNKLEIVNEDGQLNHNNSIAFARAMGADNIMSSKMYQLFELCKFANVNDTESCHSALEVVRCFRYGIFQLHWAPVTQQRHKNKTAATRVARRGSGGKAKLVDTGRKGIMKSLLRGRRFNKKSG